MPKHLLHNLIPSAMSPPCQNWDRTLKKKILPHANLNHFYIKTKKAILG